MTKAQPITVFLPDTRGVEISRYGMGNAKIGFGVFTYSRIAGNRAFGGNGTCPGATTECERVCYAKRIEGPVRHLYQQNLNADVPPIPDPCELLRIHVSGDFDSVEYIAQWVLRLTERPDVQAWAYTRSWRVPSLLPALEVLRALPNVQLFASMDTSHEDTPPAGWRRAWLDTDQRVGHYEGPLNHLVDDGTHSYVCPEETGHKKNCLECAYCWAGQKHDVTFLLHEGKS